MDRTFEQLVELLLNVTKERDELREQNRELHVQLMWKVRRESEPESTSASEPT